MPPLGNESRPCLAAGTGTLVGRQQGPQSYNSQEVNSTHSSTLEEGLELQLEITALEDTLLPPQKDLKKRIQFTSTPKKMIGRNCEIISGYCFEPLRL